MGKDILNNVELLQKHPERINKLIDRVIKEIEALRTEGYELYTITVQKQQECCSQMRELNDRYRENKYYSDGIHHSEFSSFNGQRYIDSQESDFYSDDLKEKLNHCENRLNKLDSCKERLENIAQQVVSINKTTNDIKQKSEDWNRIYITILNALKDLNK